MTLVERPRSAQAGHARDQELVQQRTAREHDGTGQQGPHEGADIRPQEHQHTAAGDQIEAGEHPKHQQFALSEVDDPHDTEDQPEADAHQSVDAAYGDARGKCVQHVLDENLEVHLVSAASRLGCPRGRLRFLVPVIVSYIPVYRPPTRSAIPGVRNAGRVSISGTWYHTSTLPIPVVAAATTRQLLWVEVV